MGSMIQLMGGKSLEEILREQMKDPMEEMLKGDVSAMVEQAAKQLSPDTVSLSEASKNLAEATAAKDYLELSKEERLAVAEMELAEGLAQTNLMQFMSADMRNSIEEVAAKGAQGKMNEEVSKASERNVDELKASVEAAAQPKDENGEPIAGTTASAQPMDVTPAPASTAQAVAAAAAAPVAAAEPVDVTPDAPKVKVASVNVTV